MVKGGSDVIEGLFLLSSSHWTVRKTALANFSQPGESYMSTDSTLLLLSFRLLDRREKMMLNDKDDISCFHVVQF